MPLPPTLPRTAGARSPGSLEALKVQCIEGIQVYITAGA